MAEDHDPLGPKCGARSAVAAGPLHEVILLGDRGDLGYYQLTQSAPWPENIHAAIVAEERRRKAARGKKSAGSDGAQ
jgi:hypothetical protein